MNIQTVLSKLATASDEQLETIASILDGRGETTKKDLRLLRMDEVAIALNYTRQTVWRLIKTKKLEAVHTTGRGVRVPARALEAFVSGKGAA